MQKAPDAAPVARNFIEEAIDADLASGRYTAVYTRFPPEPNGYLHIGHAKAFCIDFGIARKYGGQCNLRFDDTNPTKEDTEYVEAIQQDIRWLGFEWKNLYYASDMFEKLYGYAELLIERGLAFVCDLTPAQMREYRGTLTEPGKNSPFRDRSPEENLKLFRAMRAGEFPDGARTLRAKIDMSSPNLNMRDPVIYRIQRHPHHRTGTAWCIYPMYDYQHPLQDAIEGITHSLCSIEYEAHRPLYDWVVNAVGFERPPRQIEFSRLNLTRTIMSKRYLRRLVEKGYVSGWDDPRMPTLCAMRRKGYPPEAILDFMGRVGVAKAYSVVDTGFLEHCVREALADKALRVMAVLRPLKVVLTNWPEGETIALEADNHPDHPELGKRSVSFGRELYIEREDFMENPPGKFFRLAPGREVRLKDAYIVRCDEVIKDARGEVAELRCSVDLTSRSGSEGAARKVKGTLHWVNAADAIDAEVRIYAPLMNEDSEDEDEEAIEAEAVTGYAVGEPAIDPHKLDDFIKGFNENSLEVLRGAKLERSLAGAQPGQRYQFLRMGYYTPDSDGTPEHPVFNCIVPLKDSWAKVKAE